jgi:3-methyladenine DNA glycosylase AlkD
MFQKLKQDLQNLANPEKAVLLQGFFKTGPGQYGEGDVFLGVVVPEQRKIAKKYVNISFADLSKVISSRYHEERLTSFIILAYKFEKANKDEQKELFDFYIKYKEYANNWDLIDVTTPKVVGRYLLDKDRDILFHLAKSKSIWDKRIAVLATFWFIKHDDFADSLKIAEILLNDKHDLIHKAVGWMLREIGKRNLDLEENFLKKYYKKMPRTMLRYAIERFEESKRLSYLRG